MRVLTEDQKNLVIEYAKIFCRLSLLQGEEKMEAFLRLKKIEKNLQMKKEEIISHALKMI